ncbi:hypothetical protein Emag_005750 [Eimeria magna]
MPFFSFYTRSDASRDECSRASCPRLRLDSQEFSKEVMPPAAELLARKRKSSPVARCLEVNSAFPTNPFAGLFGSSAAASAGGKEDAADKAHKARADAMVNKYLQTCHSFCLGTQLRESGYSYQFGPTVAISSAPDSSLGENAPPPPPHFFAVAKFGTDGSLQGRLHPAWVFSLLDFGRNVFPSLDAKTSGWLRDHLRGQLTQQPDFKSPIGLTKLTHSCKVQYARKVTDRLSMATECEYSYPDTESALRVGWEYLFRQARVQGLIDSCGRISVFAQDYSGFGVSGQIDYWRGTYKFGFLMHVVPPPDAPQAQTH